MITVLTGTNSFEIARVLRDIEASFGASGERFDGSEIEVRNLPDILMGATLFASKRLVIISDLASNSSVWSVLPEWLARLSDDVQLVLIEPKLDKRTKTYKELQKVADIQTFAAWTERDTVAAETWVKTEAKRQQIELDQKSIRLLVARVGNDQWALYHALEKLALLGDVTPEIITRYIDTNPSENVFLLFDAALAGKRTDVAQMLETLKQHEDPYMVFGLLSSQMMQLAALVLADKSSVEVASDIGAHPFALSKLAPRARNISRTQLERMLAAFADADARIKSGTGEPWLMVERVLVGLV